MKIKYTPIESSLTIKDGVATLTTYILYGRTLSGKNWALNGYENNIDMDMPITMAPDAFDFYSKYVISSMDVFQWISFEKLIKLFKKNGWVEYPKNNKADKMIKPIDFGKVISNAPLIETMHNRQIKIKFEIKNGQEYPTL